VQTHDEGVENGAQTDEIPRCSLSIQHPEDALEETWGSTNGKHSKVKKSHLLGIVDRDPNYKSFVNKAVMVIQTHLLTTLQSSNLYNINCCR
jgi:hypothetical protein